MKNGTRQVSTEKGIKTPLEKPRYCTECGSQLIRTIIEAEKYFYYEWGEIEFPYTKYSKETGKRQYVHRWYCVNVGLFKSKHTDEMHGKILT